MFPLMRTPAAITVLILGLGGCSDSAAPSGSNLVALSGLSIGACGRSEHQLRCWGSQGPLTGGGIATLPMQPGGAFNNLELVRNKDYIGGCGLDGSGALFCWNVDGSGYAPRAPTLRFNDLAMTYGSACAVELSGTIYCWGGSADLTGVSPEDMQVCGVEPDTYSCVPEPTPIASTERFSMVASGDQHTCGLAQSGQVFCWGWFALGAGPDIQDSPVPIPVESPERFSAIAAGAEGTCAISRTGQLFCWGNNNGGMLGPGEYVIALPEPVSIPDDVAMKSVTLGSAHSCTIDSTGSAWCWGTEGLGTGASSSPEPARVLGALNFVSLAAGSNFTCGISRDGAWCWGDNSLGQLGNGNTVDSPIPVRVASQDAIDPDD